MRGKPPKYLFVPELDQTRLVDHDLIPLALARLEQFGQGEPLASHLVSVIGIDELIVVDAIWGITLDTLNGRLTAIESYDVVDKALASWRKLEGLGWVGSVVFVRVGLANLELLARDGGVFRKIGHVG